MYRRTFIATTVASPAVSRLGSKTGLAQADERTHIGTWRQFEITTTIILQNSSGQAQLWLPLAQTAAGYQTAIDVDWQGNGRTELVRDPTYGAQMLRSTWDESATLATH